ncbi:regulatory protein [Humitalea rosea]|uniref:Regulatory protein RecX n=1 Tax=Humitalea rosea TaxID=990373 RepID=A0A2W7IJJ1_9PROT|nr:RecX family transcriptional regulator [Humitalea rosea]PZW47099.1 regulatory protein [Humitalea rosea]
MADTPPSPAPDAARLREVALAHLGKFAATEVGLRRVLERRIARWAREAEVAGGDPADIAAAAATARAEAAGVARALAQAGIVDDASFAAARAGRLQRGGKSRRAIAAHLAAKGVGSEVARAALPEGEEAELLAALGALRRRRAGPFAMGESDGVARNRALAALARAGFPRGVAVAALEMSAEDAEALMEASRAG